jgi:YegS/Rv2252/BmrU family lipid kinase
MGAVSTAARTIAFASDATWRRVAVPAPRRRLLGRRTAAPARRPLADDVVEQDGEVVLARDATPADDPVLVLRVAQAAAWAGLPIAPHTLSRLAAECPPVPVPWPRPALDAFTGLLAAGAAIVPVFEALDQAELLSRLLPEWESVRSKPQRNSYHRFTVDRHLVEAAAAAAGWGAPAWYTTTVEDPGRSMAEQAAISGAELVIVCGGDGTVRTVCAELAGTGVSVGVVPAGTGNLLARNLGIPLFLQAAVDVALNGQDRAIDLVKVSGDGIPEDEHFMVMAGMGFDAAVMEGANEQIKAKVGWLAYVVSGLRNLMFPAVRLEVSIDGGEWSRHRARTVVIGNVGYLQAGMPLLPDAAIDDGVLDVVLLHPSRFLSWIPLAVRVLSKGKRTDDLVNRMTGRTVSVRAHGDTPRQLDGDSIGRGRELHCECVHGKLLVRVPR